MCCIYQPVVKTKYHFNPIKSVSFQFFLQIIMTINLTAYTPQSSINQESKANERCGQEPCVCYKIHLNLVTFGHIKQCVFLKLSLIFFLHKCNKLLKCTRYYIYHTHTSVFELYRCLCKVLKYFPKRKPI